MEKSGASSVKQYGLLMLLFVSLLPAILKLGAIIAVKPLDAVHGALAQGAFFLAEVLILATLLYFFTAREGGFQWKTAIPYQSKISPLVFIGALAAGTAYGIYFRDFFDWSALMGIANAIEERLSFWPPEIFKGNEYTSFDANGVGKNFHLALIGFEMVAIGLASGMQTLYFRGFVLPRMEYMGWVAPFANTVLFAVFHIQSPWFWHLFFMFTLSWGVLAYLTKNVWPVVIAHMIFNMYTYAFKMFEIAAS